MYERFPGATSEAIDAFIVWSLSDVPRDEYQWSKWDGTPEHANDIVDMFCARATKVQKRLGIVG